MAGLHCPQAHALRQGKGGCETYITVLLTPSRWKMPETQITRGAEMVKSGELAPARPRSPRCRLPRLPVPRSPGRCPRAEAR